MRSEESLCVPLSGSCWGTKSIVFGVVSPIGTLSRSAGDFFNRLKYSRNLLEMLVIGSSPRKFLKVGCIEDARAV